MNRSAGFPLPESVIGPLSGVRLASQHAVRPSSREAAQLARRSFHASFHKPGAEPK